MPAKAREATKESKKNSKKKKKRKLPPLIEKKMNLVICT